MKKLLFLIPLILLSACDNHKTYTVGEDAFCVGLEDNNPKSVFCRDANEKPITGIVIENYENGGVLREMTIKNGIENGIEKEYYENGQLHVVTNVKNSRADGLSKLYNIDGTLYMEMVWTDGVASDIKVYDESGNAIETLENL